MLVIALLFGIPGIIIFLLGINSMIPGQIRNPPQLIVGIVLLLIGIGIGYLFGIRSDRQQNLI